MNRRAGSPEERRDQRRCSLLEAALGVIGTEGYQAATVEQVCRKAAVSTRDFYREFANREDLIGTLFEEQITRLTTVVGETASLERPGDAAADTQARVEAFVHGMVDDPRVARLVILESVGISPATEARRRAAYRRFQDLVAALAQTYAESGQIPERDFRLLASGVVGGIYEIIADWLHQDDRPSTEELAAGATYFVRLVFAGILPEELPDPREVPAGEMAEPSQER